MSVKFLSLQQHECYGALLNTRRTLFIIYSLFTISSFFSYFYSLFISDAIVFMFLHSSFQIIITCNSNIFQPSLLNIPGVVKKSSYTFLFALELFFFVGFCLLFVNFSRKNGCSDFFLFLKWRKEHLMRACSKGFKPHWALSVGEMLQHRVTSLVLDLRGNEELCAADFQVKYFSLVLFSFFFFLLCLMQSWTLAIMFASSSLSWAKWNSSVVFFLNHWFRFCIHKVLGLPLVLLFMITPFNVDSKRFRIYHYF